MPYFPGEGGRNVVIFRSVEWVQLGMVSDHTQATSWPLSSRENMATVSVLVMCGAITPAWTAPSKSKLRILKV